MLNIISWFRCQKKVQMHISWFCLDMSFVSCLWEINKSTPMHTNVIILNTLFGISQGRYYIFIAGHNESSTTLRRSMTSSTQALSLLCEMLACLLVQCPSKFLSPLRIQFKVMQKNACSVVYLEKSFETVLVNVE